MAYIVTVQDPASGARRRLEVAGETTAEAIVASGRAAPGMRVLDVQKRGEAPEVEPGDDLAVGFDDAPEAASAPVDLSGAATVEPTIQWRRARPAVLPYLATLAIGLCAGGAGALWLTDGFATLGERVEAVTTGPRAQPVEATDRAEDALDAVHATDAGARAEQASDTEASLPPETHRIVDTGEAGTVYRVITKDEATGYLYETLIRAQTADDAAAWCADRTRMEIVGVERLG